MVPARTRPVRGEWGIVKIQVAHRLVLTATLGAALVLIGAGGCVPVRDSRGYILNERALATITPGRDTRTTVLTALGTPTAVGTFQANNWYYIGTQTETVAYKEPVVLDQQVVAIAFTDGGVVTDIHRYSLADAIKINPTDRETPTRGREMSLLEQLLGNIGRFNPRPGTNDGF